MQPARAVIILNYKRPQNIGRIARAAREALPDATILVIDQAESDTLKNRTDVDWPNIWLLRHKANKGAGVRVALAASLPFDHYVAIDDDTFLTAAQIARLAELLREDPDRVHGIWGQRVELTDGQINFRSGIGHVNESVSILNQAYAFTRAQAANAVALSARVGFATWGDVWIGSDIFLTCSAEQPGLCHDLGPIELCPTANEAGVAFWRSEGFRDRRLEIARRLVAINAIAVFQPTPH